MNTKSTWLSKTVWFNVLMTVLDILALLMQLKVGGESLALYLTIFHGIGNVILRIWFTNTKLV